MFSTALTMVKMHVIYRIFEVGEVLSHGKIPLAQATYDLEINSLPTELTRNQAGFIINLQNHKASSNFYQSK